PGDFARAYMIARGGPPRAEARRFVAGNSKGPRTHLPGRGSRQRYCRSLNPTMGRVRARQISAERLASRILARDGLIPPAKKRAGSDTATYCGGHASLTRATRKLLPK